MTQLSEEQQPKMNAPDRIWLQPGQALDPAECTLSHAGTERVSVVDVEYVRVDLLAAWLPIETNPKDETWQIVAKFDDSGKMVWWQRAYWSSRRSLWKTEGGYCTPTHWTPLPASVRKGEG